MLCLGIAQNCLHDIRTLDNLFWQKHWIIALSIRRNAQFKTWRHAYRLITLDTQYTHSVDANCKLYEQVIATHIFHTGTELL